MASGLAARGLCAEVIEGVFNEHELLTCEPVLLELREIEGIPISSPRQFWQKLAGLDEPDKEK